MKKVQIIFTHAFLAPTNGKLVYKNNYVIISGDIDTFVADKKATGYGSFMEDGDHKGKPRVTLPFTTDRFTEMDRFLNKDGIYDWSVDKSGRAIDDALFAELPESVQQQQGLRMIAENKLKKEQMMFELKTNRALRAIALEKADAKASKVNSDLKAK
jgi:hypothetical protein